MENARFRLLDNKAFLNPDPSVVMPYLMTTRYDREALI